MAATGLKLRWTAARLPATLASSGALTRNPLPMIDASGITVAFQRAEVARRFENARYPASNRVTTMIAAFRR